jgi:bifunctional non-homologous end joining protein LigD
MKKKERPPADRLEKYRDKRSAQSTPEPFGGGWQGRSRLFVVQKHAARSLHYDLRLELGGVLLSWAVPKGPSADPAVKRLAVEVEEHPVEYADFEGIIPAGNYGAGAVIVFDRGRWVPIEDPEEGLRKGKLLFDLWGHKLRGRWTLFRTKDGPKSWLLVKKPDAHADPQAEFVQESILSGRTVEDLRDATDPAADLRDELKTLKAPRAEVEPRGLELMLARSRELPFSRPGWLFELKYDGFRLIAARRASEVLLRYRRGRDVTASFPEIAAVVRALPFDSLVLDGELVVLDAFGKPSFRRLQQRVHLTRASEIQAATVHLPVTLFVFDLLAFEEFDLRPLPLLQRKKILQAVVPPAGSVRYADHFEEHGSTMFEEVGRLGFEGIVAKQADAPYTAGRSGAWLKIRADRVGDFVVVGFSRPQGSRTGVGALHLAVHEGQDLVYAGRVGTGFDVRQLEQARDALEPERREEPPCVGRPPKGERHVWVEPRRIAEVRYKEWTGSGMLRHPVFLRFRDDKTIEECERRDPEISVIEPPAPEPGPAPKTVSFTNLTKVFWPDEGYTKGDLIEYYRAVSSWLLPYLADRPVVLTRYPDGISGKNFFQKDAPGFVPDWIRTETMWSEHAKREIRYFVCEDEETLLYLANLGTIPLHLWSSRMGSLQYPDWCILDLDPKQAPFTDVVRLARAIHRLCSEIGLDCFVKTSGSSGLHVLLPLGGQCTYEHSRGLGELLARVIVAEQREIATLARTISARDGRVYIDFLQNGHGRLLVSPFSVRPLPGAPVSAPLRWQEVNGRLQIGDFTIRTLPPKLRRRQKDPWAGLLGATPDLQGALSRLHERLSR